MVRIVWTAFKGEGGLGLGWEDGQDLGMWKGRERAGTTVGP